MPHKLFGTDGIRAVAGEYPLDPPSIHTLGRALVGLLRRHGLEPRILLGRDTRESGPWMESALVQGVLESKGEPISAGVLPTSAVSFLTKTHGFAAGVVLSASHNPFQDNGIKIFSPEGLKIAEDWERELETAVREKPAGAPDAAAALSPDASLAEDYAVYLKSRVRFAPSGSPLHVVLDCANGASSVVAPRVFCDLGFKVTTLNDAPNGRNINRDCGSLHPEGLARAVLAAGADMGVAFDGDADRALWADEKGRLLNGDHTIFVLAHAMKAASRLKSDAVVGTTMTNMGLELALGRSGIKLFRTRVGDKYVLDEMMARGANLGGERSGHTIFLDDLPTGDGILTALKLTEAMAGSGRTLSALVHEYVEWPQVLVNVRVTRKADFGEFPDITAAVEAARVRLGEEGRLDLRYSGTELLARVMVEGHDGSLVEECAETVAAAVRRHLGEK